jgi:hypothetical protein
MVQPHIVAATALEQTFRKLATLAPNAVALGMFCVGGDPTINQVKEAEVAIYKQYGVYVARFCEQILALEAAIGAHSCWLQASQHACDQ